MGRSALVNEIASTWERLLKQDCALLADPIASFAYLACNFFLEGFTREKEP